MSAPAWTSLDDLGGLLARAKEGEDAALEALIARYEPRLFALARAILKDPDAAEDAVQEALLRMVRKLPEFDDPPRGFDAWVLTIARHAALDLWRRRKTRDEAGFDSAAWEVRPEGDEAARSPLDELVAREDASWIAQAVDSLPGPYREVLVLRFVHDLQPGEIARVTGLSAENARIRLWRALRELRRTLNEDGEGTALGS